MNSALSFHNSTDSEVDTKRFLNAIIKTRKIQAYDSAILGRQSSVQALIFFSGFLAIALQVDHLTVTRFRLRFYIQSRSTTVAMYISDCHYIL